MARVAVVHNTLDFRGGADAVALTVCDALDADHTVELVTISATDPGTLAGQFGLSVDVPVRQPAGASVIAGSLDAVAPYFGAQLDARSALVQRFVERHGRSYDLAVSTTNELSLSIPSVQYVHFPQFHLDRLPAQFDSSPGRLNGLWSRLAGPTPGDIGEETTLLGNSEWTADAVEGIYGRRPTVVYPPVEPIEAPLSWDRRERGVVLVGRIAPDRRVLDAIDVVDRVRERGYDVHLHVVGVAPRSYRTYVDRVRDAATERPYVHVETDASRDRLEALLRSHRYGLNVRPDESFGIALAEFVSAGMIAFAPNAGGQREVLDGRDDRLFDSLDEAVELLVAAIDEGARPELPPNRFAPERFRESIRQQVTDALETRGKR